ncbi:RNA polymerase sigma factor [Mesorhizobium sp. B2-4-6]|uniref:RNA polymerase sigma factor n=1 Tax=Mesorhizobium sp. B2-4-6 TaxID=2589943 RepID=UPI00112EB6D8|nr:RNA polymerase sigma factor [Mesorhizobium sp. B2-4-6]TPL45249.1 RNA polymerase sigma factor [Mesorhizobium sp. B2-4-6]
MSSAGFGRAELEAMLVGLRPKLHRYAARMAGSAIEGEDIVQEAVVKALAAHDGGARVERPEQWLFRIVHNAAQDHLRRRQRERSRMSEADMTAIADLSASAETRLATAMSLRSFMRLTPAQRSAVILVDVLGLSLHETCEVTGATLAAVKAALHRGRAELKAMAALPDDMTMPKLDPEEKRRLRRYVDLFNARDFDGVRMMIAEDIQVDVVNRARLRGKKEASTYFGNYDRMSDWALSLGFVEARPAILIRNPRAGDTVRGFVLIDWRGDEVVRIRDFRHVPYCAAEADILPVPGERA